MPVRQSAPPIMIGSSALTAFMQTLSPAESETAIVANKLAVADAPSRCFFGVATIFSSLATDLRFVGYLSTLGRNLRSLRALPVTAFSLAVISLTRATSCGGLGTGSSLFSVFHAAQWVDPRTGLDRQNRRAGLEVRAPRDMVRGVERARPAEANSE